eukprot:1158938-Pelagomonas_calceolata.AAC.1
MQHRKNIKARSRGLQQLHAFLLQGRAVCEATQNTPKSQAGTIVRARNRRQQHLAEIARCATLSHGTACCEGKEVVKTTAKLCSSDAPLRLVHSQISRCSSFVAGVYHRWGAGFRSHLHPVAWSCGQLLGQFKPALVTVRARWTECRSEPSQTLTGSSVPLCAVHHLVTWSDALDLTCTS